MTPYNILLGHSAQTFDIVINNHLSQFDIFVAKEAVISNIIIDKSSSFNIVMNENENVYDILARKLSHSSNSGYYRSLSDLDDNDLMALANLTLSALEYMKA